MNKAFTLIALAALTLVALWPRGTHAATRELYLSQSCLPNGTLEVQFFWYGNDPNAQQQWLDLSLFDNGWQWGTFVNAGPLPARQDRLTWTGLLQDTLHYVRINQLLPDGTWDPSPTFYFYTGLCPQPAPPQPDVMRVEAPIESAEIVPGNLPGTYRLHVVAGLPGGCARQAGFDVDRSHGRVVVKVYNTMPAQPVPCTLIYGTYELLIDLGVFPPGQEFDVDVNGRALKLRT